MTTDALRGYLMLASGLADVTRQRAREAAKNLVTQVGAEDALATASLAATVASQTVQSLADELLATVRANREQLAASIADEVASALGHLDLPLDRAQVETLRQTIAGLEERLESLLTAFGAAVGRNGAAASAPASTPPPPMWPTPEPFSTTAATGPAAKKATRQEGDAHQGGEQEGDRDEGNAHQGGEQEGDRQEGDAHQGGEQEGDRQEGDAHQGGEQEGDRQEGDAHQGGEQEGDRQEGDAHQGGEQEGDRQEGDTHQGGEQEGDRQAHRADRWGDTVTELPEDFSPHEAAEARPQRDLSPHEASSAAATEPTGDPRVDSATERLDDLRERPIDQHPEVFEEVHRELAEALDDESVSDAAEGADAESDA